MTIRLLLIFLLLSANLLRAEVIEPRYSGECIPPGWLPRQELDRPRLGLALSGGGFRGMAQIGVLKALENQGVKIDCIAGVSMGAIVGALYATGYSPAEIHSRVRRVDWAGIFLDRPSRRSLFLTRKRTYGRQILQIRFKNWKPYFPPAITSGQKISMLLNDLMMRAVYRPDPDFDHLKFRFRTLATDLESGEKVVFSEGNLAQVLQASSAFPVVFSPVIIDGRPLIDGGMLENIPVLTARNMGADKVIAVNIASPLSSKVEEPWEIINQITSIMMEESMQEALASADLTLEPAPDTVGSYDFELADSLVAWGQRCASENMEKIKSLRQDCYQVDSSIISITNVIYQIEDGTEISEADKIAPASEGRKSEIGKHLCRLYEKYEFQSVIGEIRSDTLIISCKSPPSYKWISLRGNTLLSDSLILSAIKSIPGKPLYYSQGVRDRENIIRLYRERGCSLAEIRKTELRNDTLFIGIDEGKIDEVSVEGGRYKALVDLGVYEGEVFDWNKAQKGINRLYSTDFYETVNLKIDKTDRGKWRLKLMLQPRPFPLIRFGQRYDIERSWSSFMEFITADLFHSGADLTMLAAPGSKDSKFHLEIGSDRIFRTYLLFRMGLYYEKHEYKNFDKEHNEAGEYTYERDFGILRIGQLISRWGLLSAAVRLENNVSTHPAEGERNPQSASLILETMVDTYDRYPFPRSGSSVRITFQSSTEIGSSGAIEEPALEYSKIYGDFQRWTPITKRYALLLRFRGGYAEANSPTYEKFTLGGINDFGGLYVREVMGNRLLAGSFGVRFDLLSRFLAEAFLIARYDIAQIQDGTNLLEFKRSFFRQGSYLAFALNTLLGPIEVGWGYAAKYKDIPDNHIFYLSIGHEF